MLDFTAFDFETANKYANSACSLAAVTMNDDQCVRQGYTLIRPPLWYSTRETLKFTGFSRNKSPINRNSMPCGGISEPI